MNMLARAATAAVGVIAGTAFGACPASATIEPPRDPVPYLLVGVHRKLCGALSSQQIDQTEILLSVANRSRKPAILYWHNTSGGRESGRLIPANGTANYTTYRGHVWEVASGDGTCLSQYVIADDSTRSHIGLS
ncbi:hypothetical protein [Actinoplanes awajinensis]|uniref:von Hippel-Lindau disease tumour suppressor beta domain-containing protein n=1 Tax=Actinoplanes awajinensis subsp. mycoplanecinus TaxID=135947 RepID=A0A0X3UQ47_9ACTN|nr:hypothetical protein [Actinoplanes awajinensis]KUL34267.1 hypothetical protein ADL15_16675 [Actinoplanes awajinensis subsp. mycoplanecinus]